MNKKILFILIGINLLLVSSISMTLAWFIGASQVYIDPFEITIDADADIRISLDPDATFETAKEKLDQNDLPFFSEFIPVSSMGSYSSSWISDSTSKKPEFVASYKKGTTRAPERIKATKGFFSFDLYLYSDKHVFITLNSDPTKTNIAEDKAKNRDPDKINDLANKKVARNYQDIVNKKVTMEGTTDPYRIQQIENETKLELKNRYVTEIPSELDNIVNSVRFSILDYHNRAPNIDENNPEISYYKNYIIVDPTKTKNSDPVVFGGRLSTSLTRDYYDYYYDSDEHDYKETIFGLDGHDEDYYKDNLVYLEPAEEDLPRGSGEASCFNAGTKQGVRPISTACLKNIDFEKERSLSIREADVSSTGSNDESRGYKAELYPYTKHHIVLTIYVEGWDRDNLDSTQEGSFALGISFKIYKQGDFNSYNDDAEDITD